MRNRTPMRSRGSANPLVIGILCLCVPTVLYLITRLFQATIQDPDQNNNAVLQSGKYGNTLVQRPSQLVVITGDKYRLVVDSTEEEEYVEEIGAETQMPTKSQNDTSLHLKNSNDNFLTSYDEDEVTNEAERDETIDYNLNWESKPTATTKRYCQTTRPVHNLVLVKTHRTGGSSLANIIYRYGDLNDLEFALPKGKSYEMYWPLHFHPTFVDRRYLNSSYPNALVGARYSRDVMERLMPKKTYFLAVLRDPVTHFESIFHSLQIDVILGMANSTNAFVEFLSQPQDIVLRYLRQNKRFNIGMNAARDGQSFDLGLFHKHYNDDEKIHKFIEDISERINIVLLAEYFDESLVLMKRELCWDLDDVVYFKFHQRGTDYKESTITEDMRLQIKKWNKADSALYKHFNRTLWGKVAKQDASFQDEVKELRVKVKILEKQCIDTVQVSEETGEIEAVLSTETSSYNRHLCQKLTMSEEEYISYLKQKFRTKFIERSKLLALDLAERLKERNTPKLT